MKPDVSARGIYAAVVRSNGRIGYANGTSFSSPITALNCIAAEAANWDAVAIIRGGGAVSDLNGFESYALASNIAQFVLPVITGIGHERDETVIDLVANTRCKTPTAVADFLVSCAMGETETLSALSVRLQRAATQIVANQNKRFAYTASRIAPAFSNACKIARLGFDRLLLRIPRAVKEVCAREDTRLQRLAVKTEMLATNATRLQTLELQRRTERLKRAVATLLQANKTRIDTAEKNIKLAGPERMFHLGFSLTTINGKAFDKLADNVVAATEKRNRELPPTKPVGVR